MEATVFKSKKIKVLPNGDGFSIGKRFVITPRVYRNFEQFLTLVSASIRLRQGAVRKVFDLKGKQIRGLDELVDGGVYVASAGDPFKRMAYKYEPIFETPFYKDLPVTTVVRMKSKLKNIQALERILSQDPKVVASTIAKLEREISKKISMKNVETVLEEALKIAEANKEPEQPIFMATSKAYKVLVFTNGDGSDPGKLLTLNFRNSRTFDMFLKTIDNAVNVKSKYVSQLFDAVTGAKIIKLTDLVDGQNLVAAGQEPFQKVAYKIQNLHSNSFENRRPMEVPKPITLFPNGDAYHTGFTLSITKMRFPTIRRLLDHINSSQARIPGGPVKKLCTIDGKRRITDIDEFEPHGNYVMISGDDPFIRIKYNLNKLEKIVFDDSEESLAQDGEVEYGDAENRIPSAGSTESTHRRRLSAKRKGETLVQKLATQEQYRHIIEEHNSSGVQGKKQPQQQAEAAAAAASTDARPLFRPEAQPKAAKAAASTSVGTKATTSTGSTSTQQQQQPAKKATTSSTTTAAAPVVNKPITETRDFIAKLADKVKSPPAAPHQKQSVREYGSGDELQHQQPLQQFSKAPEKRVVELKKHKPASRGDSLADLEEPSDEQIAAAVRASKSSAGKKPAAPAAAAPAAKSAARVSAENLRRDEPEEAPRAKSGGAKAALADAKSRKSTPKAPAPAQEEPVEAEAEAEAEPEPVVERKSTTSKPVSRGVAAASAAAAQSTPSSPPASKPLTAQKSKANVTKPATPAPAAEAPAETKSGRASAAAGKLISSLRSSRASLRSEDDEPASKPQSPAPAKKSAAVSRKSSGKVAPMSAEKPLSRASTKKSAAAVNDDDDAVADGGAVAAE